MLDRRIHRGVSRLSRRLKAGSRRGLIAAVVLSWLSSPAFAEPIDVCWRPPTLAPGVDTFVFIEKTDGFKWTIVGDGEFAAAVKTRQAYRYNPDLGPDSLGRFPQKDRPKSCTPPPPEKKKVVPPKAPAPSPGPPAPKKNKTDGDGDGDSDGKKSKGPEPKEPKEENPPQEKPPSDPPKPVSPRPETYEEFHKRVRNNPSLLPWGDELPPSESNLPRAEEASLLPDADEACVLPTLTKAETPVPVLNTNQVECIKKKGDEKGPINDRTRFDELLKEFALFVGAVNLRLDEDLNRPDGKKYGVVGGRNADGPDHPVIQAVISLMQLAPAVQASVEGFIKKVNQSVAKKVPAVVKPGELTEEAAEWLAKQEGAAQAIAEAGTIGPYKIWQKLTAGQGGQWQAHHIVERKWFGRFVKGDPELAPSVILGKAEHAEITANLAAAKKKCGDTLEELWKMYVDVYRKHPHWLEAIKSYFNK